MTATQTATETPAQDAAPRARRRPRPQHWPQTRPAPTGTALRRDEHVQGNVLAGFNKDHQVLLMLRFPDAARARTWLGRLAPRLATTAAVAAFNERFSQARRLTGSDPDLTAVWTNLSLTSAGLAELDPAAVTGLRTHPDLSAGLRAYLDGAGTPATCAAVGDVGTSAPDAWLFGRDGEAVHAVVCVAADRADDLETEVDHQRELAATHGLTVVFEQTGGTLPDDAAGHEHFGFKDGISQPGVTGFDEPDPAEPEQVRGSRGTDLLAAGTFVCGYPMDDPDHTVAVPRWMFDGSFLVTRRLAQDVPGFWAGVEEQAATLPDAARHDPVTGIEGADALAARLVGRWRSGTPTDHAPLVDHRSSQDPLRDNDFDFADDPDGDRTPPCAHIRKVYPRAGAEHAGIPTTEDETRHRRIMRRGIPFGQPFQPTAGRGEGVDAARGLVFQCYQADLAQQFVFLQQRWVNFPGFPDAGTGTDVVIGHESDVTVRAGGVPHTLHLAQFVQTQGALYSFTPSLPTVRALAAGEPLGAA